MAMPIIVDKYITSVNRPNKRNMASHLCIHWTANEGYGATALANATYLNNNDRKASAHYVVDSIHAIRCIPENEIANSVGAKKYTQWCKKTLGNNPNSRVISLEWCVNSDGDFWATYSHMAYLAADILHRHGWSIDRMIRHYDVTGKNCPAFFVEDASAMKHIDKKALPAWQEFKKNVDRILKGMK